MPLTTSIPTVAVVLFVLTTLGLAGDRLRIGWRVPAVGSLLFLVFSLYTIAQEGLWGFWAEHTRSLWGNQVWLDLLLAVSIGWLLILPEARARGMRPLPWLLLVFASGCVALLAMVARLLYLRERDGQGVLAAHAR